MAMSYEQFMQASGAELVCGNLIVGLMQDRKKIGERLDGTFTLNEEGQKLLSKLEEDLGVGKIVIQNTTKTKKKAKESTAETIDLGDNISIPKITEEDLRV
jgi:hypothetical protein